MKVLVACEESGVVRDAFKERGHEAWSCDLLNGRGKYFINHFKMDVFECLDRYPNWDMALFFPPCTHLCVSGARWFKNKKKEQDMAIDFVERLWQSEVPRICIENPIGVLSTKSILGKPSQIIQPWQFGHGETKATCLWLADLPLLLPTNIVSGREARIHKMPPSPDRARLRSETYMGVARAMAKQWGDL